MIKLTEYETRKLHVSVPANVYDYLRANKLFKSIDGIVTELIIEHYNIGK